MPAAASAYVFGQLASGAAAEDEVEALVSIAGAGSATVVERAGSDCAHATRVTAQMRRRMPEY